MSKGFSQKVVQRFQGSVLFARTALAGGLLLISGVLAASAGFAAEPQPWGIGFQRPATPVAERIQEFHDLLLVIIFAVSALVAFLLVYILTRFREGRNKVASKNAHNTMLEVVWTAIPVLIVFFIVIQSMKLLYFQDRIPEAEMTVKVTGKQWFWTYEYPDHDDIIFDSFMLTREEAHAAGKPALLGTDNPLVIPAETTVRIIITASDVLHAFAVPAFGIKTDAVPGRLNENWVHVYEPGVYYGQCSELCGRDHAFMPIEVVVLPKDEFEAWLQEARATFGAAASKPATRLAGLGD